MNESLFKLVRWGQKVVKFGCLRGFLTASREICTYFVRVFVIASCAISEMFNFEKILTFTSDRVRDKSINDISRRKCLTMATGHEVITATDLLRSRTY